jgi:ABC-type Mn2+/Zn2+ transport system permease subunit
VILDWLFAPFISNPFMANALMAGMLVSVACGIVGTYVVLRGLAFIGDALAHGVLPGVALAVLFGWPAMAGAAVGALAMIAGIGFITKRSSLSSDTAIGLLFVGMLALGVAIVSRSQAFSGDLVRILFGEILGIGLVELLTQLGATVLIGLAAFVCHRPFMLLCFSPDQAQISGFSPRRYHGILLLMIAFTVVVSFRTVGTLLVFGMLLAPAASAALLSRKISTMVLTASLLGVLAVYVGLLVSYHFNLAAGASITLVATAEFFTLLLLRQLWPTRKARKVAS